MAACGTTTPAVDTNNADRFEFIATVNIDATTSQAELETDYDASVIVFRPEAGFAILGLDADAGAALSLQARQSTAPKNAAYSLEPAVNLDQISTPEAFASGFTSWSGGFTSWSGGFTSWSGGFSSWSGGFSSWSGGNPEPTTFIENVPLWEHINLSEAEQYSPNFGAGVKVAVIDTGIDLDHPAFSGKLAPQSEWRDFIDNDAFPMDESGGSNYGHGTAVAGIIIQIAPNSTILPIRVLKPDGSGDVADVVAAVDHAISMGADVINLSLGTNVDVPALEAIVSYAETRQVFVVSSAGNSGDENVTYPAAYALSTDHADFSIGVGSVDASDIKSSFSTYGDTLAMVAPGEFVYTLAPGSQIAFWSGTSMSAPVVAGAAALGLAEVTELWQLSELPSSLVDNSENINKVNHEFRSQLGAGRLDVLSFLKSMGL